MCERAQPVKTSTMNCASLLSFHSMNEINPLVPPLRFSHIQDNLFRGGYPRQINFSFLESLKLKTIISLTPEPIDELTDPSLYKFASEHNIQLVHIECAHSGKGKKRGVPMGYTTILEALSFIIHDTFAPVYFHCLNGGQVTSLVVACLRKIQFWSSIAIFNEFINFTSNMTVNDRSFVDGFRGEVMYQPEDKVKWLWVGISKGVIGSHPTIKVTESKSSYH